MLGCMRRTRMQWNAHDDMTWNAWHASKDKATTANNWRTPGTSVSGRYRCSWRSIRCNLLLRCVCWDPMNCDFMIWSIHEYYLSLIWSLICMIIIASYFFSETLVWFGQLDLFFLKWVEVLCDGFNLVVCSPGDSRGCEARIVLFPLRIKRWGLYHIARVYPSTSCHLA